MFIEILSELDEYQWDALTDLTLDASEYDGIMYSTPDDSDFWLFLYDDGSNTFCGPEKDEAFTEPGPYELAAAIAVYALGESFRGKNVFEIEAFSSPPLRRRGFLELLLSKLKTVLSEICGEDYILKACVRDAMPAAAVLRALGAFRDHDELLMERSFAAGCGGADGTKISTAKDETEILTEELTEDGRTYTEGLARSSYAELKFRIYAESAYIYEVLTYAGHEHEGHMKRLMSAVLNVLDEAVPVTRLEVSSANESAVRLYERLGFVVSERLCCYYL